MTELYLKIPKPGLKSTLCPPHLCHASHNHSILPVAQSPAAVQAAVVWVTGVGLRSTLTHDALEGRHILLKMVSVDFINSHHAGYIPWSKDTSWNEDTPRSMDTLWSKHTSQSKNPLSLSRQAACVWIMNFWVCFPLNFAGFVKRDSPLQLQNLFSCGIIICHCLHCMYIHIHTPYTVYIESNIYKKCMNWVLNNIFSLIVHREKHSMNLFLINKQIDKKQERHWTFLYIWQPEGIMGMRAGCPPGSETLLCSGLRVHRLQPCCNYVRAPVAGFTVKWRNVQLQEK